MRERFKLSLSVFCFLERDDEVLLLKRSNTGWMDGFFSVPAGAHNGNQTLDAAIARELLEEIDVVVEPDDLTMIHTIHCLTEGSEWIGVFFVTSKWKGEPKVNEPKKHSEVRWNKVNNLPENTIPYVKQALEQYKANNKFSSYGWENT